MNETWRSVPGYEGAYEVSDLGRVRSVDRFSCRQRFRGRVLATKLSSGYPAVTLYAKGRGRSVRVHCLVLEAFVGPRPAGAEGCHKNGDRTDPRLDNLRWDTSAANKLDRVAHGTANRGMRHGMSRLVATDVERIFDLRRAGCKLTEIAEWIGTTKSNVSAILRGKSWQHSAPQPLYDPWQRPAGAT